MLDNLIDFVKFTHKFQQVKRRIIVNGEDRNENDAEHSYQLALTGWYIIEKEDLNLDKNEVIKYALVHDLVEVHAGDTFFHTKDEKLKNNKKEREKEAAEKIKKEFSEFKELNQLIHNYEEKADKEARFVYSLDKILPVLNIYLDNGRSWKRDKVTYEMIRTKDKKIKVSPNVKKYWDEFAAILEEKKEKLFYKN